MGLHSRPDLNGRRVEVLGRTVGKDGAPRVALRLLPVFGAGAGAEIKVKAANLELDGDGGTDPGLDALVREEEKLGAPAPGVAPADQRDWARGLPKEVLLQVAETLVAQTEAEWAAWFKARGHSRRHHRWGVDDEEIQEIMEERKRDGNCLFVFALVCKEWRKAQLEVGAPLCSRVESDVLLPGQVGLVKWALAEGCPTTKEPSHINMAWVAAQLGHLEVVRWLCGEGGFAMERRLMWHAAEGGNLRLVQWLRGKGCPWDELACCGAAGSGNLELLQWLRAEGCPWDYMTGTEAVKKEHMDILSWARENGCPWHPATRNWAAKKLGYTDDFGNLQNFDRTPMSADDPYTDHESDDSLSDSSSSHSESDEEYGEYHQADL